jgi:hypothetical protein
VILLQGHREAAAAVRVLYHHREAAEVVIL